MARPVICLECSQGKHAACNGEAILTWDDDSVTLADCDCATIGHVDPEHGGIVPPFITDRIPPHPQLDDHGWWP